MELLAWCAGHMLRSAGLILAAGNPRGCRPAAVTGPSGVLERGVDRQQRVSAGEAGDLVQRAARADRKAHLPAPDGGLAVGLEQVPDR